MDRSAFKQLVTNRLILHPLTMDDNLFILKLVNNPGWLKFIGDRNVNGQKDAEKYISKIMDNPNALYWVVKLKDAGEAIGVITFLKRDYLYYYDLGFAFMPLYQKQGYAFEAASIILKHCFVNGGLKGVQAITIPDNINSVGLLTKLGFIFDKEMLIGDENILVYELSLPR